MDAAKKQASFGTIQLELHAQELGNKLRSAKTEGTAHRQHLLQFRKNIRQIESGHRIALQWASETGDHSPVVEWLLDNYPIVRERIRDVLVHLPRKFFRELPRASNGTPRIQIIADELILHSDASLDDYLIVQFVNNVQERCELTIGECWALGTFLKFSLIERLRFICSDMEHDYIASHKTKLFLKELERTQVYDREELRTFDEYSSLIELYIATNRESGFPASLKADVLDLIQSKGLSLEETQRIEQQRLAACQVSIANVITSLRLLDELDWSSIFEEINLTDQVLRNDPTSVYEQMDFHSRNRYRSAIEDLSTASGASQLDVARSALQAAIKAQASGTEPNNPRSHIGFWLIDSGRATIEQAIAYQPRFKRRILEWIARHPNIAYFGTLNLITGFVVALFGYALYASELGIGLAIALAFLALIPISEIVLQSLHSIWTQVIPVNILAKLELNEDLPKQHPTFVVVPSMLASERDVSLLLSKLEGHFLANAEPGLRFALLTDFADSDFASLDNDDALVAQARDGIEKLNERYQSINDVRPFYLFHRRRTWNPSERKWMGWERKRGKLMEFGRLLLNEGATSYETCVGDLQALASFADSSLEPFIITLDADTVLPRDTARRLIGTLAHPLNRPDVDGETKVVKRGYVILQPRVSIQMESEARSWYHRLFASGPGIDPYASAISDVYQDIFHEGSFTGKGIYDLRAFEKSLKSRFPENRILSHDLIEGCHARVAYTSDIEVFDSYPQRYDADAKRQHRWTRGDWQIATWLLATVPTAVGTTQNQLSLLSKWKILDNLRRSLVPIATMLLLLSSFIVHDRISSQISAFVGCLMLWPIVLATTMGLRGMHNIFLDAGTDRRGYLLSYYTEVIRTVARTLFQISMLPQRASSMLDAVLRTLWRVLFSRKNMLEWETAAASEARLVATKNSLVRQLFPTALLGLFLFVIAVFEQRLWLLPWPLLWLAAPIIADATSRIPVKKRSHLATDNNRFLLDILSATWGYFERFADPDDSPLPPDNVQELPVTKVANRISPTNEGLFLVSVLTARHFGMVGHGRMLEYLESNLERWLALERYHGHHFNWYDTISGRALPPRYVSTVDSGNLLACYLTLSRGLESDSADAIFSKRHYDAALVAIDWLRRVSRGIDGDFESGLTELSQSLPTYSETWLWLSQFRVWLLEALQRLATLNVSSSHAPNDAAPERSRWDATIQTNQVVSERFRRLLEEMERLSPWIALAARPKKVDEKSQTSVEAMLPASISLKALASFDLTLLDAYPIHTEVPDGQSLQSIVASASHAARELLERIGKLQSKLEGEIDGMQFGFLYNAKRKLLSIGLNVESRHLDKGYYDMLASECRLSSFLAIAKGDIKTEHWFHLGRQSTEIDGRFGLLSWGGTMFEFLMPTLFQRLYPDSVLDKSCTTAIRRQIQYGKSRGAVWGVGESAYSGRANNSDYLYKSFGVPGLGLKRGLTRDYVVSPYSTALALPFAPHEALANFLDLARIAMGTWGFYDAIDFTKSRLRRRENHIVVRNHMAHHQGMTILAIANSLDSFVVQKWFHASPLVRAAELLLQEKSPLIVTIDKPDENEVDETVVREEGEAIFTRRIRGYRAFPPKTLFLSNQTAHTLLTHVGGSCFRWNEIQVTRWRPDTTRDSWGTHIYLRDQKSGLTWSAAYHPTRIEPDEYEVLFSVDKGSIRRRQGTIETTMEVTTSPEHDAEVRLLRITNQGTDDVTLDVTSYTEIALINERSDLAHPAFYKLFVETEFVPEDNSIVAKRRPRDRRDDSIYASHTIAVSSNLEHTIQFDSSRESFLGRGRTTESPAGITSSRLAANVGPVVDPAFALRCTVNVPAGDSVLVGFTTACARTREEVLAIADHYQELRGIQRAFELSWAQSQVELQHLNLTAQQIHSFHRLGGNLIYPNRALRGDSSKIIANRLGQSCLWRFGISGDYPMILARIASDQDVELAKELLIAGRYLLSRGIRMEIVLCNDYPGSYFDEIRERLQAIVEEIMHGEEHAKLVFILRGTQLTHEDHQLLDAVATILVRGDRGSLADQLNVPPLRFSQSPRSIVSSKRLSKSATSSRGSHAIFDETFTDESESLDNGFGRFGVGAYHMAISTNRMTPAPWTNVLSNPMFGCLITESGSGYTWYRNSRENKLSSWSNDPTTDPPSEVLYVYDLDSELLWSPLNMLGSTGKRHVIHRHGATSFHVFENEIESATTVSVDWDHPLKRIGLKLHNHSTANRRLRLTFYVETVLGVNRESTAMHQHTEIHASGQALLVRNGFHSEFPEQVAYVATRQPSCRFAGDRSEFLDPFGSYLKPAGAIYRLTNATGAALDPCLAIQCDVEIRADEALEIEFVFGVADNDDHLEECLRRLSWTNHDESAANSVATEWKKILGTISIDTPNHSMNTLFNDWLLYQTLSCRIWGRSGFYQSGGAFGFRDQLQDVMAMVYSRPDLTRDQILRAAARQYLDGSVQHWWHPPSGKGTKTRFSDDFLFLPLVVCHYCKVTGDLSILSEQVPFIESLPLLDHEQERYEHPTISEVQSSLLEHCILALKHGMQYGSHGLPLMGCGDWNDGMNRIGEDGKGESVWVAWFQVSVFQDFADLLERQELEHDFAPELRDIAERLKAAIEVEAWDGRWYRRAFFDNGSALGTADSGECQIDSISQSWAVFVNGATERTRQAFDAAIEMLYDRDAKLLKLFTPSFDVEEREVGYIQGYLPGVRENGGQYTHAALWMLSAAAKLGEGDLAVELFDAINPMNHSKTQASARRYRLEPYAIAADVYANESLLGRGGWSWYTGSAAWMYRVVLEDILGFDFREKRLIIQPSVPHSWKQFTVTLTRNSTIWKITVNVLHDTDAPSESFIIDLDENGLVQEIALNVVNRRANQV